MTTKTKQRFDVYEAVTNQNITAIEAEEGVFAPITTSTARTRDYRDAIEYSHDHLLLWFVRAFRIA
ncbi:MAG: hypothetical protein GDA40_08540 [Rhodobacteraceae bacterium]|nr:hypothetical protein [Paracoccaceae bacterium]